MKIIIVMWEITDLLPQVGTNIKSSVLDIVSFIPLQVVMVAMDAESNTGEKAGTQPI